MSGGTGRWRNKEGFAQLAAAVACYLRSVREIWPNTSYVTHVKSPRAVRTRRGARFSSPAVCGPDRQQRRTQDQIPGLSLPAAVKSLCVQQPAAPVFDNDLVSNLYPIDSILELCCGRDFLECPVSE